MTPLLSPPIGELYDSIYFAIKHITIFYSWVLCIGRLGNVSGKQFIMSSVTKRASVHSLNTTRIEKLKRTETEEMNVFMYEKLLNIATYTNWCVLAVYRVLNSLRIPEHMRDLKN